MNLNFKVRREEYLEVMTILVDTYKALRRSKSMQVRNPTDALLFILRRWRDYLVDLQAEVAAEVADVPATPANIRLAAADVVAGEQDDGGDTSEK